MIQEELLVKTRFSYSTQLSIPYWDYEHNYNLMKRES